MNGPLFDYSQADLKDLCARDAVLARAIEKIGPIKRRIYPDALTGLIRAITGQQVSARAHESIWQRFTEKFRTADPEAIATTPAEQISSSCGMSRRKADYIRQISAEFANGNLSHAALADLDDETLREKLVQYKGIGNWTVDMLLIFTFQRRNVLSYDDLAIRRGMMRLYGHADLPREVFQEHYLSYRPQATLASLYLWEIAAEIKK